MKKLKWRVNIHNFLISAMCNVTKKIPQPVIDAIDAAYIAGIDESKANALKRRTEEIIGDLETNPLKGVEKTYTLQYWIEAKQKQLRNKFKIN